MSKGNAKAKSSAQAPKKSAAPEKAKSSGCGCGNKQVADSFFRQSAGFYLFENWMAVILGTGPEFVLQVRFCFCNRQGNRTVVDGPEQGRALARVTAMGG